MSGSQKSIFHESRHQKARLYNDKHLVSCQPNGVSEPRHKQTSRKIHLNEVSQRAGHRSLLLLLHCSCCHFTALYWTYVRMAVKRKTRDRLTCVIGCWVGRDQPEVFIEIVGHPPGLQQQPLNCSKLVLLARSHKCVSAHATIPHPQCRYFAWNQLPDTNPANKHTSLLC